ncbi:hypothetical protein NQ315_003178 [Exocentrus adspersus]|uniref:Uncharacterized protein n=1 Tax=Exocentrus adspersus TaxID=1586481 RepID=A0AAV8VMD5_9CUCU|nr:hypothetical protein NQ315_003178 [Exocentrus adspersus]
MALGGDVNTGCNSLPYIRIISGPGQSVAYCMHHIHATDEGKNQKPKGKAFYIGLAFVELGSQKKEIGNTSVQNIIRVTDFRHHIHATDEGKNQKPKGKAFYIGLAFVELGSQKKRDRKHISSKYH